VTATSADPFGTHAAAITNGMASPADESVVALTSAGRVLCTGVLVAPRLVLTAAHCTTERLEVVFGAEVDDGSPLGAPPERFGVLGHVEHPEFHRFHRDAALLVLERASGASPLTLTTEPVSIGTRARVVGFGFADWEDGTSEGSKRTGAVAISDVTEESLRLAPSPSQPCAGDSGGPVLAGADERVIGVISSGDLLCRSYGTATPAGAIAGFVAPFIEAMEGCPDGVDCTVPATNGGCTSAGARRATGVHVTLRNTWLVRLLSIAGLLFGARCRSRQTARDGSGAGRASSSRCPSLVRRSPP
jgi:hypothetical protein